MPSATVGIPFRRRWTLLLSHTRSRRGVIRPGTMYSQRSSGFELGDLLTVCAQVVRSRDVCPPACFTCTGGL